MTVVLCADDRGGLVFHGRRQSRDLMVRADLLRLAGGRPIWMDPYSREQFTAEEQGDLRVSRDILAQAEMDGLCFLELQPPQPYLERAEELIVYRWNRLYPADRRLALPPPGWHLARREDFPGHSHPTITREVYCHETA